MDETQHFSQRLGRWVQLVRSEANDYGWQDVVPKKLARGKVGYNVKMRLDPENSSVQSFLKGGAVASPRAAAIRRAEFVAEHPFPPKAAGRKVCCPCYLDAMTAISLMCDCACATVCVQRKLTSKEETNEEDVLSSRPAWVIDHNLCHLWSEWGLDEEGIFRRTSASRRTRWRRSLACRCGLRRGQVAELEQAGEQQQPHPPQPQPRRVRLR